MVEFLKLIIKELPVGYSLHFLLKEGFAESSIHKGIVVQISIKSSMGRIGQFSITRDLIEQGEQGVVEHHVIKEVQKLIALL